MDAISYLKNTEIQGSEEFMANCYGSVLAANASAFSECRDLLDHIPEEHKAGVLTKWIQAIEENSNSDQFLALADMVNQYIDTNTTTEK